MNPTVNVATSQNVFTTQVVIIAPLVCAIIFLLIRVILFFVEERELRLHARNIFAHALKFTPSTDIQKANELFVTRLMFYMQLIVYKKVYLADLEKLLTFVDKDDTSILASVEFLKNAAK